MRKFLVRTLEAAAVALLAAAVYQELRKPKEERQWYGEIAGLIPYDFRFPTWERLVKSVWDPGDNRLFVPEAFGIGWSINFYTLLTKLEKPVIEEVSEEDFLMPTPSIKRVLAQPPTQ